MNEHNHNVPGPSFEIVAAEVTRRKIARSPQKTRLVTSGDTSAGRISQHALRPLISAVLAWLWCSATGMTELNAQTFPPPVGSGIVTTLQADQDVYTNQPAEFWCPPCTTNIPPCMLPCYLINEEKTAVARFTFTVQNQYNMPRAFQFASGQQFDIELIDQTGRVVAAWSDDKFFTQSLTSFALGPGDSAMFTADMSLQDRDGQQLYGPYQVRAFLTTSGPRPRVEASGQ